MTVDLSTEILKPFDDDDQGLLKQVDLACRIESERLKEEVREANLKNEDYEMSIENIAWTNMIRAYGILFNRAVQAGWVTGVHLEGGNENNIDRR